MNATQAKKILSNIPAEDFIIDKFTNEIDKCCSVGHLTRFISLEPNNYSSSNCSDVYNINLITGNEIYQFRQQTEQFLCKKYKFLDADISDINNCNNYNGYTESEIKDRIIHLLDDMIEAGY